MIREVTRSACFRTYELIYVDTDTHRWEYLMEMWPGDERHLERWARGKRRPQTGISYDWIRVSEDEVPADVRLAVKLEQTGVSS